MATAIGAAMRWEPNRASQITVITVSKVKMVTPPIAMRSRLISARIGCCARRPCAKSMVFGSMSCVATAPTSERSCPPVQTVLPEGPATFQRGSLVPP
jgi:hypothetical protein